MCAFRHGMIKDAHDALVDIQSSGRSKELLAQVREENTVLSIHHGLIIMVIHQWPLLCIIWQKFYWSLHLVRHMLLGFIGWTKICAKQNIFFSPMVYIDKNFLLVRNFQIPCMVHVHTSYCAYLWEGASIHIVGRVPIGQKSFLTYQS